MIKNIIKKFLPETLFSLYILLMSLLERSLVKIMWATLLVGIIFYLSLVLRKLYSPRTIFLLYIPLLLYGASYYIVAEDLEILTLLPFLFLLFVYKYRNEIFKREVMKNESQ